MTDEAAVMTAPDAGAASSPADAGAGAAAAPAAAPSAPAAPQTDEEILGIEPLGAKPAEAVPVHKTEQAQPEAAKPAEDQAANIAEDGRLMPVKWRELAKSDPEFRTLFYEARANREKLASIEPQFTETQAKLAAVEKADQAYLSGDPAAIQAELRNFVSEKPDVLLPMLKAGENAIKEMMPQEYARMQTERFTEMLRSNNFGGVFQVLRNAMEAGDQGLDVLKQQISKILEWADGNGFPTTEKAQIEARARELDARDQAWQQRDEQNYNSTARSWRDAVNAKVDESIKGAIKESLDKLLKDAAFTDGAKQRIGAEALAEVYKILSANTDITDQIGRAIWPNGSKTADGKIIRGNWNDANRELAIRLPVEHGKSVLNDVLKKVVDQYTSDFMATTKKTEAKVAAAAARTDLSGGTPTPRAPKPLTKKDVDYGKMSDTDILNA